MAAVRMGTAQSMILGAPGAAIAPVPFGQQTQQTQHGTALGQAFENLIGRTALEASAPAGPAQTSQQLQAAQLQAVQLQAQVTQQLRAQKAQQFLAGALDVDLGDMLGLEMGEGE
eukprot:5599065-Prymnesium_polylepis.1